MSTPLDVIALRGLSAYGTHGVLPDEQVNAQPFIVDLALWVDTRAAADSDDIDDTISYAEVADLVCGILTGPSVRLIETLGSRIAAAILEFDPVEGVEVTVHKPNAPIGHPFSDVSVTVRRGTCDPLPIIYDTAEGTRDDDEEARVVRRVVLALGGNIGNAPVTLMQAIAELIDTPRILVREVSPLIRTAPVLADGQDGQDDYWNAVVIIETDLEAMELLETTSAIETRFGRERNEHWGPRTLDIDLIDVEGVTSDSDALTLPHPRAARRAFVLAPWLMVDPNAVLADAPVVELLEGAPDKDGILDAVDDWLEDPESVSSDSDDFLGRGGAARADGGGADVAAAHADEAAADEPAPPAPVQPEPAPVPTPSHEPEPITSRLDLMPEASRRGLAPATDGDDVVWRTLWARWEKTDYTAPPADLFTQRSVPAAYASLAPAMPAGLMDSSSAEEQSESDEDDHTPPVDEEHAPHDAAPVAVEPAAPRTDSQDPDAEPAPAAPPAATTNEPDAPTVPAKNANDRKAQRRPQWKSLTKYAAEPPQEPDVADEVAAHTPLTPEAHTTPAQRELPQWDFASADVRIVDDPAAVAQVNGSADAPASEETDADATDADEAAPPSPAEAPSGVVRTSILDPKLPKGALRGPIPDSEVTQTGILRKVIVRPSTTGHIPIVKNQDGQQ